jgi:hypothetical protein
MAKIEMDLSEYEIMQENKKLLEKSLENERLLREEIEKLNKEKIKALEDAKMKVVYVKKTKTYQHALVKHPTIRNVDGWRRILRALGFRGTVDLRDFPETFDPELLRDAFFEVQESTIENNPEITVKGLEEVKQELRSEAEQNLTDEIKRKLEEAKEIMAKKNEWLSVNKELSKENSRLKKENNTLATELDDTEKEVEGLCKEISGLRESLSVTRKANAKKKADVKAESKAELFKDTAKFLSQIQNDILGITMFNRGSVVPQILSKIDSFNAKQSGSN